MAILPVGISGESQYQISRSLRFNSADSAYLNRTPASAGNRQVWTYSTWIKRSKLGAAQTLLRADSANTDQIYFLSTDKLSIQQNDTTVRTTTRVFRDVSAWWHIVIAMDTTQAIAANRTLIYLNGVQVTAFDTNTDNAQNTNGNFNNTVAHSFGSTGSSQYFDGYQTETHWVDGQALDPTSFGEFNSDTGVWQPIKYTGTYGTNGFYLNFSDNSGTTSTTLGKDYSGNGNNWTPNNFSVTAGAGNDSLVDVPTRWGSDTGAGGEVRGNYATGNPLFPGSATHSNGNLDISQGAAWAPSIATISVTSGKWYFEVTAGGATVTCGVANASFVGGAGTNFNAANCYGYYGNDGKFYDSSVASTQLSTYGNGDVIGVAFDADSGKLWFAKNGTWQASGDPANGTNPIKSGLSSELWRFGHSVFNTTSVINFGQRPFAFSAPSGFKALVTTNLP